MDTPRLGPENQRGASKDQRVLQLKLQKKNTFLNKRQTITGFVRPGLYLKINNLKRGPKLKLNLISILI